MEEVKVRIVPQSIHRAGTIGKAKLIRLQLALNESMIGHFGTN